MIIVNRTALFSLDYQMRLKEQQLLLLHNRIKGEKEVKKKNKTRQKALISLALESLRHKNENLP